MAEDIYILRISLNHIRPPIWRRVAVPGAFTFGQLHIAIQIAMGWTNSHLHHFRVKTGQPKPTREQIEQLDGAGRWDELTTAFRGERMFGPHDEQLGDFMPDCEDEAANILDKVCPAVKSKLTYEYDFGDNWEHTVEVQKIEPPKPNVNYPVCLAGKRDCPPEDCGGPWGYADLLDAIGDPKHEQHEDLLDWLGGDFDPEAFDRDEVNEIFADWRRT